MYTTAQQELKIGLAKAIEKWMEDQCETALWQDVFGLHYVGEKIDAHMAEAAFAVLMSVVDVQEYIEENAP